MYGTVSASRAGESQLGHGRPAAGEVRTASESVVGVAPEQDIDSVQPARREILRRLLGNDVTVHRVLDRDIDETPRVLDSAQVGQGGLGQAGQRLRKLVADGEEVVGRAGLVWPPAPRADEARAALDDGAVEEPVGDGRGQEVAHRFAAGRLARDRDLADVAAEARAVGLDPAQRGDLVQQAVHPAGCAVHRRHGRGLLCRKEAQASEAVVDGDHDDILTGRQHGAVVGVARARREAPAVDPAPPWDRSAAGRRGQGAG